jgi:hypothetical protein
MAIFWRLFAINWLVGERFLFLRGERGRGEGYQKRADRLKLLRRVGNPMAVIDLE